MVRRPDPAATTRSRAATRCAVALAAAATLLAAATHARAEDIRFNDRDYADARVLDIRAGAIRFTTRDGIEAVAPIAQIQRFHDPAYPTLAQAFDALNRGEDTQALALLLTLQRSVTSDHLRALVATQLIYLYDRAADAERAVEQFVTLVQLLPTDQVRALAPANLPADRARRDTLAASVAAAIDRTRSATARLILRDLENKLRGEPEPHRAPLTPPGGAAAAAARADDNDPVATLLNAREFDKALQLIDQTMLNQSGSLSRLLYQRGEAYDGLGNDHEAALAYMRIVIHYSPATTRHYQPALVRAGAAFKRLDQPQHARALWTEARALVANDPRQAAEIDQLLASLPAAAQDSN